VAGCALPCALRRSNIHCCGTGLTLHEPVKWRKTLSMCNSNASARLGRCVAISMGMHRWAAAVNTWITLPEVSRHRISFWIPAWAGLVTQVIHSSMHPQRVSLCMPCTPLTRNRDKIGSTHFSHAAQTRVLLLACCVWSLWIANWHSAVPASTVSPFRDFSDVSRCVHITEDNI